MTAGMVIGALVVGAIVGYLLALAQRSSAMQKLAEEKAGATRQAERVPTLEAKLDEIMRINAQLQARVAELTTAGEAERDKTSWVEKAEDKLRDAFQALASNALTTNSEQFAMRTREQIVQPLEKKLTALDTQVREMEKLREGAYKGLDDHLGQLREAYDQLRNTTSGLASALTTSSGQRGQWGEVQLRRIVEMAGMVEHVDFEEQESTDEGRPDMVVKLPNGGVLPVDAKTTMKTYLEAVEATDDATRRAKLKAHAAAVKTRVRDLSGKEYWKQFKETPDVVVMFIPNEACLSGAFEGDGKLFDYGLSQRVLIAAPVTLFALLRTVAFAWQQHSMAENAREIAVRARELSDRMSIFIRHLRKTGKSLDSTVKSYNDAVGSLHARVEPSLRRFKELGVASDDPPTAPAIESQATLPPSDEAAS